MLKNDFPAEVQKFILCFEDLKLEKSIGSGAYGEVWEGIYIPRHKKVAIKKLHANQLGERDLELYKREITALSTLKFNFLLPFIGFTTKFPYCIVTQFISNGSLYNALHDDIKGLNLTATDLNIIAFGIATGMNYLHHNKMIHRDLKSQNVLIDERKLPVICDFGSSKYLNKQQTLNAQAGTPNYMAPEFLQNEPYDEKIDIYSYGVLLWEIITHQNPFDGLAWAQILCLVVVDKKRLPIPEECSPELTALINTCWDTDPKKRPSFDMILKEFTDGNLILPGASKKGVMSYIKGFQNRKKIENRKGTGSVTLSDNTTTDFNILLLNSTPNKSMNYLLKTTIPAHQLRQTAISHLTALSVNSQVQQQLNAISFLDDNSYSPVLAGLPIWNSILKLACVTPQTSEIYIPLQDLIINLARRADLLQTIASLSDLHTYLAPQTLDLFLFVACFLPDLITKEIIYGLFKMVLQNNPDYSEKASLILVKLVKIYRSSIAIHQFQNSQDQENFKIFYQLILTEIQSIILKVVDVHGGSHFLYCLTNQDVTLDPKIIPAFSLSTIDKNAIASYKNLFSTNGFPRGFRLNTVCAHIKSENQELRQTALEFIRRYETKEDALTLVIESLIYAVNVYKDEKANLLLCRAAANLISGKVFTFHDVISLWMDTEPSLAPKFLKVFILLVQHQEFGGRFILHKLTPTFLDHCFKHSPDDITTASTFWIMSYMNMTPEYAQKLVEKGTAETFLNILIKSSNEIILQQSSGLLSRFIQYTDLPQFDPLTSHLLKLVNPEKHDFSLTCIQILTYLSSKTSTHNTIINENAIATLSPFLSDLEAKHYIQTILLNLKQGGLNIPII